MNTFFRGWGKAQDAEDIYIELKECLSKMPQGFPSTLNGIEIKILKKLFSPEEARIYITIWRILRPVKAQPSNKSLQKKLNMTEEELRIKLNQMARSGLLLEQFYESAPDRLFYAAPPFLKENSFGDNYFLNGFHLTITKCIQFYHQNAYKLNNVKETLTRFK